MKRTNIAMLCMVGLLGAASPALAQETPCAAGIPSVQVREGENLWGYKQSQWTELKALNPKLDAKWRQFITDRGGPGVKLKINETICGVTRDAKGNIVPASEATPTTTTGFKDFALKYWKPAAEGLGGLLLLLALGFLALCVWVDSHRKKDPVTSGKPVVPGGITSDDQARERFASRVEDTHRPFDIVSLTQGTAVGDMLVTYRDQRRPLPRRFNGDEAIYWAVVRYRDDESEENLYMLQRCGNDLTPYGGVLRYVPSENFVFTPDEVATPAPAPVEVPAATVAPTPVAANEPEPVVETAPALAPVRAVLQSDGSHEIHVDLAHVADFHHGDGKLRFTTRPAQQPTGSTDDRSPEEVAGRQVG